MTGRVPDPDDPVEESDEESFPASDPPSTWSGEDDGDEGEDRLA